MKAGVLLLVRVSTGVLLLLWGSMKVWSPENAIGVSEKYYAGLVSAEALQAPLGIAQMLLGALVVLGLLRVVVYPVQALVLGVGLAAIWKHILDPFGLYLQNASNLLFFPSMAVAACTLVLLAFRADDRLSLDQLLFSQRSKA